MSFWNQHCNDIVLKKWVEKYPENLQSGDSTTPEATQKQPKEAGDVHEELADKVSSLTCSQDLKEGGCGEHGQTSCEVQTSGQKVLQEESTESQWAQLWELHWNEVYWETYESFAKGLLPGSGNITEEVNKSNKVTSEEAQDGNNKASKSGKLCVVQQTN